MGIFCTTTSLETQWGTGNSFSGLTALASDCITDAENEVKKRLAVKYDVGEWTTSAATPPMVQTITKWLAVGYLYEATARGSKEAFARADRYIKRGQQNLDEILAGKAELTDSSGDVVEVDAEAKPVLGNTTDYHPTFNEDSPLNWRPDSDKLDDIDDERD